MVARTSVCTIIVSSVLLGVVLWYIGVSTVFDNWTQICPKCYNRSFNEVLLFTVIRMPPNHRKCFCLHLISLYYQKMKIVSNRTALLTTNVC